MIQIAIFIQPSSFFALKQNALWLASLSHICVWVASIIENAHTFCRISTVYLFPKEGSDTTQEL